MDWTFWWKQLRGEVDDQFHGWSDYYTNFGDMPLLQRHMDVIDLIEPCSNVMDIGCGNGILLEYLRDKKWCNFLAVEDSDVAIKIMEKKGMRVQKASVYDVIEWGALGTYWDYIILCEVIEHLRDPEVVLRELSRFTRNIVFSVPNTGLLPLRLAMLNGHMFAQCSDHIRFWTYKDMPIWLEKHGFTDNIVSIKVGDNDRRWRLLTKLFPNLFGVRIVCKLEFK